MRSSAADTVYVSGSRWVWRTPLHLSQPYWEGWYKGLSDLYMTVTAPKVLILAGTDRLDRSLTVGQMQGKFQLVLLPQVSNYWTVCPRSFIMPLLPALSKLHHLNAFCML